MDEKPKLAKNNPTFSRRYQVITVLGLGLMLTVCYANYGLMISFFPLVAKSRGASTIEIGLIYAMFPIGALVISPFYGLAIPFVGTRYSIWAGLTIEGIFTIIFGLMDKARDHTRFVAFCALARFGIGLGTIFYSTALFSIIGVMFREKVATVRGLIHIFIGIGFGGGPLVGALLYTYGGFSLPFFVIGGVMVTVAPILTFILPNFKEPEALPYPVLKNLCKLPYVIFIVIGYTITVSAQTYLEVNFAILLQPLHLGTIRVALLIMIPVIIYIVLGATVGFLADRWGHRPFVVTGLVLVGISLQLIAPAPYFQLKLQLPLVIISLIILGMGLNLVFIPSYGDLLTVAREENIGDNLAVYSVTSAFISISRCSGLIIGPIFGGFLASLPSLNFAWSTSIIGFIALFQALVLISYLIYNRKGSCHRASDNTYKKVNTDEMNEDEGDNECHNLPELHNKDKNEKISSKLSDT